MADPPNGDPGGHPASSPRDCETILTENAIANIFYDFTCFLSVLEPLRISEFADPLAYLRQTLPDERLEKDGKATKFFQPQETDTNRSCLWNIVI